MTTPKIIMPVTIATVECPMVRNAQQREEGNRYQDEEPARFDPVFSFSQSYHRPMAKAARASTAMAPSRV